MVVKMKNKQNIDSIITFLLLKKLITPFTSTIAYKLGLIDLNGKIIKVPETDKEKDALTILDRVIFKLKRLLGNKIINFNKFMYLKTLNIDMYDKLNVKGTVEQRAEIIRINKDIRQMQEKYNMGFEDILQIVLNESLEGEI
jgi:hypothetical protein